MKFIIGAILGLIIVYGIFTKIQKRTIEKTKVYKWKAEKEKLKNDFIEIISKNQSLEYLIVEFDSYYIQYIGLERNKEYYCEIVSDKYLSESKKYSKIQKNKILEFDFSKPNTKDKEGNISSNYSKWYKSESENEINLVFEELLNIIESIYHLKDGSEIIIKY